MTNQEAITIVSDAIKRYDKANGHGITLRDDYWEALRIVNELAWMYEETCK